MANPNTPALPVPPGVPQRILVVEDLEDQRASLQELLQLSLGVEVDTAEDGAKGLEMLRARPYSLVITDLRMPKVSGMKLIETVQSEKIPATVIVTTGHGSIKDAVEAMRQGAHDFLTKPADPQHLILLVKRALRERGLQDEVTALRQQLQGRHAFQNVLSKSPRMHDVFELVGQIADTTSTVLIRGETGTGKEQVARAIHQASAAHRTGSFVAVNCGALNENLLESELFGHEKGSYTGADRKRVGRFELAHGGTLFLDEIGDVPMSMQIKLLRVLQERRFERVGGGEPIDIDVRVIAATHQDMEKLVKENKFREDLYYRLNVVRIDIPPLRDRPEDVPLLVAHFCQKFARPGQKPPVVSPEAMEVLLKCPWPGNVRQLENAIERACVTARDGTITPDKLPGDVGRKGDGKAHPFQVDLARSLPDQLAEMVAEFEKRYLRKAMKKTRGHVGKCAEISGLSRRSITDKIAQYGIDKGEFKKE
ncbi:fis family transcriptional regulator : Response regulator with CheY-like receiver, AAA-type ATPase, and DNA-binding domains OS=Singulisphaera acidiphila (strain ATCC BAA-1392 / DSM 18658 / VKM B-2454 / MOB10) GN=Sinac_1001 PE=4 SV=1: Response_reg: Sigma54_activat: HTH_8 [Gemmataceae bacterium]|nr:fis family transcriptional regulator : Response regulator with CheY-like receiver, AAA-type ATPase, and DNA-binding domains OS=Singulisphaera acidiphila (strain ATCC BAA-1392 / DSM 18658 / VKM B-2454 / MOB10) GN=Sinac_1001 PE=4 SV=1: Response_reg: Sigma54_activat: HTH_8 [Gemmataceae bacterium]VTT97801.1 fis family transcriptional regulator : Response regulator with CheY-like receiver, AAA-type ATPase, and DNA-binding domains OS=Singulisphaera acidiphila (strain ATCC BAA-1392 / DSM 18658 / VKM B